MSDGLNPTMKQPSAWHPCLDPVELAVLGKLAEELNECGSAVARCIIQGFDEHHPTTNKNNGDWLLEEIADVLAGFTVTLEHFNVNRETLEARTDTKIAHLKGWHKLIQEQK